MGQSTFPDAKKLRGKVNYLAWFGLLMAFSDVALCSAFLNADVANHPAEPNANTIAHDKWAKRKAAARCLLLESVDESLDAEVNLPHLPPHTILSQLKLSYETSGGADHLRLSTKAANTHHATGADINVVLSALTKIWVALAAMTGNHAKTDDDKVLKILTTIQNDPAWTDKAGQLQELHADRNALANAAGVAAGNAVTAAGGDAAAAAAAAAAAQAAGAMTFAHVKAKLIAEQERRNDIAASNSSTRSSTPTVAAAAERMPQAEWLAKTECHNCHVKGHLVADCNAPCRKDNHQHHTGRQCLIEKKLAAEANGNPFVDPRRGRDTRNPNQQRNTNKIDTRVAAAVTHALAAAGIVPTPAATPATMSITGSGAMPAEVVAALAKNGWSMVGNVVACTQARASHLLTSPFPPTAGTHVEVTSEPARESSKNVSATTCPPLAAAASYADMAQRSVVATAPLQRTHNFIRTMVPPAPQSTVMFKRVDQPSFKFIHTMPAPASQSTVTFKRTDQPSLGLAATNDLSNLSLPSPSHLVDLKLDSCASEHFLGNDFGDVLPLLPAEDAPQAVTVANGEKLNVEGKGSTTIGITARDGKINCLRLERAHLVRKISWNLLSVRRLTQHGQGLSVTFLPGGTTVEIRDHRGDLVGKGTATDAEPLYKLTAHIIIDNATAVATAAASSLDAAAAIDAAAASKAKDGPFAKRNAKFAAQRRATAAAHASDHKVLDEAIAMIAAAGHKKPKSTFASGSQSETERTANVQRDIERTHKRDAHADIDKCKKILIHEYALDGTLNLDLVRTLQLAELPFCKTCRFAKQKRTPLMGPAIGVQRKATESIEWQHTDMGSMGSGVDGTDTIGYGGERYFKVIVDGKDKMGHVILLKTKGATELFPPFIEHIRFIENQHDKHVKVIQSDGGEMTADVFVNYCKEKGVFRQVTPVGVPKRNSVAERRIGVLTQMTASLLIEAYLPLEFWPDALVAANNIYNFLPQTSLNEEPGDGGLFVGISPYEARYGSPPDTRHLRIFGCPAYLLQRRDETIKEREKLGQKSLKVIYLGTAPNGQGFKVFDPVTRKVYFHEFVEFDEDFDTASHQGRIVRLANGQSAIGANGHTLVQPVTNDPPSLAHPAPLNSVAPLIPSSQVIHFHRVPVPTPGQNEPITAADPIPIPPPPPPSVPTVDVDVAEPRRSARSNAGQAPIRTVGACFAADDEWESDSPLDSSSVISSTHAAAATDNRHDPLRTLDERGMFPDEPREPTSMADLANMSTGENVKWWDAMREENDGLVANNTWTLRPREQRDRPIPGKWVWKLKRDAVTGAVARYKARWVVKGFMQVKGRDYNETFAPCPRMQSFRFFCCIANAEDLDINMDDVSQAFLNGDMGDDKVTITQPTGFEVSGKESQIGDLNKGLYGTMQGARQWNIKLDSNMAEWGYSQNAADPCFYTERDKHGRVIGMALIWVDDIVSAQWVTAAAPGHETLSTKLAQMYKTTSGPLSTFCAMRIQRDRANRRLFLSQSAMINAMLTKYNMQDCHPVGTPMVTTTKLSKEMSPKTDEEKREMESIPYRELIGELGWLAQCTRPETKFATGALARFVNNPGKQHWEAAKHLLRYYAGTQNYGLMFEARGDEFARDADGNLCLMKPVDIFCDADYTPAMSTNVGQPQDTRLSLLEGYIHGVLTFNNRPRVPPPKQS